MGTGDIDIETVYRAIVEGGIDPITGASFDSIPLQRRERLVENMAEVISRKTYETEADAITAIEEKIAISEEIAKQPNAREEPYNPDISAMLRTSLDTGAYKTSARYRPKFGQ